MSKAIKTAFTLVASLLAAMQAQAQEISLSEAIATARAQSVEALEARHAFVSTYWAWRSYKASRLPSLYLYGDLMNYNRSLTRLQSYEDGSIRYVGTNNLQNSIGLQLKQNVTFTGGTVYLYSDLSRLDQFSHDRSLTWYSQPVTISYVQPLFAYNPFKWEKKIEPKEYERGRRTYIESMEEITIRTVSAYFDLILARMGMEMASSNYANATEMLSIAKERLSLGSVTRDECLQLELKALNDSIAINESQVKVREAQMKLNSVLGYDESFEVVPVLEEILLDIQMDYDLVMEKALRNSTFSLGNEIELLNAESAVAKAKADRGISMSLNARFGLSQNADTFGGAYLNPLDQEVVGLTFSVPIFDWGLGKGRVQKAKAAQEVVRAQVQQAENDFRRTIFMEVGQFNNQARQCSVSERAMKIARERLDLMMEKFRLGNASVLELNTAQSESDEALRKHISDICSYWNEYYTLRKYTLYDFVARRDIDVDVLEMVK